MNRQAKSIKIMLIAALLCAGLVIGGAAAFADTDLLSPSGTQVSAGSGLSFTVNMEDVKEEYDTAGVEFTLTVNISPAPEYVSVSPEVSINQFGSKYSVKSADLSGITALTFTVYPGSGITSNTSYNVTADIAGDLTTKSDSFTFTAVPVQNEEKKSDSGNMKAKGAIKGGSIAAAAVSGGTSSDTSTVYKGSEDNYLKKLAVEGYDFTEKFNSTRDTYFIEIPEGTESVDVSATAHDSSAAVRVAGNESVAEDGSKIMISVTADNGDVRTYRIFVNHGVEDEE